MTELVKVQITGPEDEPKHVEGKLVIVLGAIPSEDKIGTHVRGHLVQNGEYTDADDPEIANALDAIMINTLVEGLSCRPQIHTALEAIQHMALLTKRVIERLAQEDEGGQQ